MELPPNTAMLRSRKKKEKKPIEVKPRTKKQARKYGGIADWRTVLVRTDFEVSVPNGSQTFEQYRLIKNRKKENKKKKLREEEEKKLHKKL